MMMDGWRMDGGMDRGRMDEQGRMRALIYIDCPLAMFCRGGTGAENHHFATIMVKTASSTNHRWIINLGRKF